MAVKQAREIVEVGRHLGMIRPQALLVDLERAAKERLGLARGGSWLGAGPPDC